MSLDEETLERVARDGEMDYSKWPSIIEPLMARVKYIVHNEFPTPTPYTSIRDSAPRNQSGDDATEEPQSEQANNPQTPSKPPVPLFGSSATSTSRVADSMPTSQNTPTSTQHIDPLPQPLLQLLNGIISTLRASFTQKPPHTIQRLAELVLNPTNHYKTLPAWLRAVDRVVNVSSTADVFPLPDQAPLINGVNGDTSTILIGTGGGSIRNGYDSNSLGSDESLGGALLTPIPWLRNGTQDTEESGGDTQPNTASTDDTEASSNSSSNSSATEVANAAAAVVIGSSMDPLVPERPDGAVTQGELMRLEQEAGVVPVSANPTRPMPGQHDDSLEDVDEAGEPIPHARGPDLVGAVDMGKVEGKNVEVSLGSPPQEAEELAPAGAEKPTIVDEVSAVAENIGAGSEEDYEMVDKADEMDVDEEKSSAVAATASDTQTNNTQQKQEAGTPNSDEDMVLVDAAEEGSGDASSAQK